jgi:prepilin-type N-terminal cleavage/methylation domain-containing protein
MSRARIVNNERGFTLAEMLVTCAIVGIVMAGLLTLVMQGQQAYWFGTTQVDGQQTVRVALERMGKEIREAGYEPLPGETDPTKCPDATKYPLYAVGVPCYEFVPITAQTATSVTLQYNWDGSECAVLPCTPINTAAMVNDPITCASPAAVCRGEQVTYSLSGTNLRRQESFVDGTPVVIASGITALAFTYMDENSVVTATPSLIRMVEISMTVQTATNGAFVTMVDRIRLRNR